MGGPLLLRTRRREMDKEIYTKRYMVVRGG
jgi:hypothetical protein